MDFFAGYGGGAGGILPRRACPCEYVARRPPHRRWVQETQPHTYGCAERTLTAEFQKILGCDVTARNPVLPISLCLLYPKRGLLGLGEFSYPRGFICGRNQQEQQKK